MLSSKIFCHSSVLHPNHRKGCTNHPKAPAKASVDVVMARRADTTTAMSICAQTKHPIIRPSRESQPMPHRVRPGESSRCIKRVKNRSQRSLRQTLQIEPACGESNQTANTTVPTRGKSLVQSVAAKVRTTRTRHDKTFTRGSSMYRSDFPE